jgi:hypothetical protein
MGHEEAGIMRQHLCFKEGDHVLPDSTQTDENHEAALVLQRTRPRTT